MDIVEIRKATGLSQRKFAAAYGIPLGTVRNWEQGVSTPPEYVVRMLKAIVDTGNVVDSANDAEVGAGEVAEQVSSESRPAQATEDRSVEHHEDVQVAPSHPVSQPAVSLQFFVKLLSHLASLTAKGFKPISQAETTKLRDAVYYDEDTLIRHGGAHGGFDEYRVVRAMKITEDGERLLAYWGSSDEYDITLVNVGGEFHIELRLYHAEDEVVPVVAIYKGRVYFTRD